MLLIKETPEGKRPTAPSLAEHGKSKSGNHGLKAEPYEPKDEDWIGAVFVCQG